MVSSLTTPSPPAFNGENYAIRVVKMKAFIRAYDLWEVVEQGGDLPELRANPIIVQMKEHIEEVAKSYKAVSCIHSAVTDTIFTRIMACETAKGAWDKLKEEFQGLNRTR